jgi:hypothetical protein
LRNEKTAWVSWFAGFLLVAVGWALVTPVNHYPDEVSHVYRAVSVVRGEIFPHIGPFDHGTGAITNVPVTVRGVLFESRCRGLHLSGNCESAGPNHPGSVTVVTSEGRRFPLYYSMVGWPSLAFPNRTGWYLMRLVSAVLCSALLAAAANVLMTMRRRPLVLAAGLFVGLTPLAVNLSGAVNPSGLEIAAAACFWAVMLALVHGTSTLTPRLLARLGAVSGVILVTCREVGCIWILLAVVLSLMSASRPERGRFLRSRSARVVLTPAIIATAAVASWTITFHSYAVYNSKPRSGGDLISAVRATSGKTGKLLQQILAYLGWQTIRPPLIAQVCWILAVLAIVAVAFATCRRVGIAVVFGYALVVVLPFAVLVVTYHERGLRGWQGRYTVPLAIGPAFLSVAPLRGQARERRFVVLLAGAVACLTLLGQLAVFQGAWVRYRHHSHWYVPLGRVFCVLGAIVVVATVTWADVRWSGRKTAATRTHRARRADSSGLEPSAPLDQPLRSVHARELRADISLSRTHTWDDIPDEYK